MIAFVFSSCNSSQISDATAEKSVSPPDVISIFYTCDTRGHINPCDCASGVAGGLPRRKTYIAQHASGDSLVVDVGNVTAGGRPWELLELEYLLRGYEAIGYQAVNIGKREAGLPAATLHALKEKYPAFVSTNVFDESGPPIFPTYRIVTLKSGYRVAVLGVVDNNLLPDEIGDGVKVLPPVEAIAKSLPSAMREADFVVLLAFANEPKLKALAERFFEVAVIIGGDVAQASGDPVAANKSTIVYITDKGKSVGEINMRFIGGRYIAVENSITTLLDSVPDDPAVAALVRELDATLVQNNYPTKRDDEDGLSSIR